MTAATLARPNTVLVAAAIGLLVAGGLAVSGLMSKGHAALNTTSLGMYWGLPIVVYDFFLLTSTGLAMVASIALVFGARDFAVVAKRCVWLALAALVGGVAVLALELGYPVRALWAIPLNFQTASPLFWKVLFVAAHLILLLALFAQLSRPGWTTQSVRGTAILALIAALGVTVLAGGVYGTMTMRPFWSSGDVPVAFLAESMLGGIAFTMFFTYLAYGFDQEAMTPRLKALFTGDLPAIFAMVIVVHALFVGARTFTGLYGNAEGLQVWQHIVRSPLFHIEVWAGLALPLALMLMQGTRRSGGAQILAAALVMVSLLIARYDYIVGGQLVPLFKGTWAPDLLVYRPSLTEWMLFLMAIFLANVVNAYGERALGLSDEPAK
jgi:molybdopterin-containing oxidoreductase family membrane subunit